MRISSGGRRAVAGMAAIAAAALAGPPSAGAAEGPALAVQPNGTAHLSWLDSDDLGLLVQERRLFGDERLGEPQWISNAEAYAISNDLAVDGSGGAVNVWTRQRDTSEVQGRRREADGSLGRVLALSPLDFSAIQPRVAASPDGSAVVAWTYQSSPRTAIQARRLSPAGVPGPVLTISSPAFDAFEPHVAMDATGNALVTFVRRDNSAGSSVVQTRRIRPDGTLGTIQPLSTPSIGARDPEAGFDAAGNAIVAWERWDGGKWVPQTRRRKPDGALSAIQSLITAAPGTYGLDLAVEPDGDATYVYSRDLGSRGAVQLRRRTAAGTLGAAATLSPNQENRRAEEAQVALDPDGHAYAVWRFYGDSVSIVQGRRRTTSGFLGAVQDLSSTGEQAMDPQVGIDGNGITTVAWQGRLEGFSLPLVFARRRETTGTLRAAHIAGR